jgi:hypothetical protein
MLWIGALFWRTTLLAVELRILFVKMLLRWSSSRPCWPSSSRRLSSDSVHSDHIFGRCVLSILFAILQLPSLLISSPASKSRRILGLRFNLAYRPSTQSCHFRLTHVWHSQISTDLFWFLIHQRREFLMNQSGPAPRQVDGTRKIRGPCYQDDGQVAMMR